MIKDQFKLLTPKQLSEFFQIPVTTIYQYVHQGYIPYLKIGGHLRFDKFKIEKWLTKRECKGRANRRIEI